MGGDAKAALDRLAFGSDDPDEYGTRDADYATVLAALEERLPDDGEKQ